MVVVTRGGITMFIDFEEVKARHPIETVAERLGLELKKAGNQLRGPCFSGAEGDRKLVITPAKGVWYSFALNEGGDAIKLVSMVNQCSAKEAAAWIAGEPEKRPKRSERGGSSPERSEARGGFAPLDYLEPDHPAVEAIGLSAEDATRLGAGYAPRGMMKGTVAIPLRSADGTLVGYLGCIDVKLPPSLKF